MNAGVFLLLERVEVKQVAQAVALGVLAVTFSLSCEFVYLLLSQVKRVGVGCQVARRLNHIAEVHARVGVLGPQQTVHVAEVA